MFSTLLHPPPLILIGMHRSGTSLLSRILNDSGIFMGTIRDHNGESWPFLSTNTLLLAASHADWRTPKVVSATTEPPNALSPKDWIAEHYKLKNSALWRQVILSNKRWGWKDPRNTFTLPFWLHLFPKAKVIHLTRDANAVANSLVLRSQSKIEALGPFTKEIAFDLWHQYVTQGRSYEHSLGSQYLEIDYEQLITEDPVAISILESFVGVPVQAALKQHLGYYQLKKETHNKQTQ